MKYNQSNKDYLLDRMIINPQTDCWEWTRGKNSDGYGRCYEKRGASLTHILSYLTFIGPIPDGMGICHTCDNPGCINPKHLAAGTQQDNIKDRHIRGRDNHPQGESNPNSKLTKQQVLEIRERYKRTSYHKSNAKDLAKEYGISLSQVGVIVSGRRWVE